jgi:hypothetical protein
MAPHAKVANVVKGWGVISPGRMLSAGRRKLHASRVWSPSVGSMIFLERRGDLFDGGFGFGLDLGLR